MMSSGMGLQFYKRKPALQPGEVKFEIWHFSRQWLPKEKVDLVV